ncbi:MAG: polysaccharide biosynthesis tyrosine autokinase [Clostridiales bacterium]|jgi:capsular exopolysaccharide synthesis family protein|nr:polysaccharide biosynthesis tyrosine autokinase [Clostridiales bacterium]
MFETILTNFHLEKIFWILKVKLKYILLFTVIAALLSGVYAKYTRSSVYLAQISFYVYSNPAYITDPTVNINSSDFTQARNLVSSYMQILRSKTFLNKLIKETGSPYSADYIKGNITASSIENTAVFIVSVRNPDPVNAMNIANAIGDLAPDEITRIVKSGGIEVLDRAELPTYPYQTTSVLKMSAIGGIGGFALSIFLFLLRGLLDTTIRKEFEIRDMFTIPILGEVPLMPPDSKKIKVNKILGEDSPFALRESYNNIRTNLRFTGQLEKCPVYAITSSDIAEGKTLNAINLAISFTQIGKKILVIDADMRKGSISMMLGIELIDGLSEYLAGFVNTPYIIEYLTNLSIISSGEIPPNPTELLSSNRWNELLENCKKEYDTIFIDLPPAGIVSDALLLTKDVTAYILVLREKVSRYDRGKMMVSKLEALGANICGFIYNGISIKSRDYPYEYYGKEYLN